MTEADETQSLTTYEVAQLQLDAWKTTVEVQQHFNDIEMKVRGLALTLVTALLGAAAVAIENQAQTDLRFTSVPLASLLVATALIGWMFFAFMDQVWYHRLLIGAVRHGEALEKSLAKVVPGIGLASAITQASPWTPPRPIKWIHKKPLHSNEKMSFFYWGMAGLLAVVLLATLFVPGAKDDCPGSNEDVAPATMPIGDTGECVDTVP